MTKQAKRITIGMWVVLVVWGQRSPCLAWFWSRKNVEVWVDDAHTRKITVPKLDPDDIAEKTSKRLKLTLGHAGFGVSASWSREKGIEYDNKAKQLIAKLKHLCLDFNRSEMSLETYRRRLREIYAAEEKARDVRNQMFLLNRRQASKAFVEMDKALGLSEDEIYQSKLQAEALLAELKRYVAAVPYRRAKPTPVRNARQGPRYAQALWRQMTAENKEAVDNSLAELKRDVENAARKRPSRSEMIEIWKDDAHRRRIKVRKLKCTNLVQDVERSLSVGAKFFMWNIGPKATWTRETKAAYDETAQLLILKYRQLCMEYNAGLVSQESYTRRLQELFDAEDKARQARYEMFDLMHRQAQEGFADLDRVLEKQGAERPVVVGDMEDVADQMRKKASEKEGKDEDRGTSLVGKVSRENQKRVLESSLSRFQESVADVEVEPAKDTVEVWVDDAKTRKVTAPKLDPDLLAQHVKSKLALHLAYYSFGPEIVWAKDTGTAYDEAAQMLVVKYKQLIMDYNAGLVSQESFRRRRRKIDETVEKAGRVREALFQFTRKIAQEAFAELDAHVDRLRQSQ